jgi:hypothetical protein
MKPTYHIYVCCSGKEKEEEKEILSTSDPINPTNDPIGKEF